MSFHTEYKATKRTASVVELSSLNFGFVQLETMQTDIKLFLADISFSLETTSLFFPYNVFKYVSFSVGLKNV